MGLHCAPVGLNFHPVELQRNQHGVANELGDGLELAVNRRPLDRVAKIAIAFESDHVPPSFRQHFFALDFEFQTRATVEQV